MIGVIVVGVASLVLLGLVWYRLGVLLDLITTVIVTLDDLVTEQRRASIESSADADPPATKDSSP